MRRRKDIQRFFDLAVSDLTVHRRRGNPWSDGTTNYLLGQAVALLVVLDSEITWSEASEVITTRVERAVTHATAPDQSRKK